MHQQLQKRPRMIRHVCRHSGSLGPKYPLLAAAERAVGADQVVTGHTDGELGSKPAQRAREGRSFAHQMGIPQPPVQIGSLDKRGIDGVAGRILQPLVHALLTAEDHPALHFTPGRARRSCARWRNPGPHRSLVRGSWAAPASLSAPAAPDRGTNPPGPWHNAAVRPIRTAVYSGRERSNPEASAGHRPILARQSRT